MNRNVITAKRAGRLIDWMAGESLHAKRVQSVTNAVVGVVNAVSLSIHAIGAGLAQTSGLNAKHAIKQVPPPQNLWVIEPVGGGVLGFVLWEENTPTTRGGSCAKPSAVLQRPVGAFWASTGLAASTTRHSRRDR